MKLTTGLCFLLLTALTGAAADRGPPEWIRLWPDRAPGETSAPPPESNVTKPSDRQVNGGPIVRLGNVSDPSIAIYRPDPAKDTGAAVVVCPGGGYSILAIELEGAEVCEWLNSIGVTGVLLKYRVPAREGRARHAAPLQDVQRALGWVRHRAGDLGLDPRRIGVLGFSAGGHLAAVVSNQHEARTYPPVDAADEMSCRPDFAVLIYPAYLTLPEQNNRLAPELTVSAERTPPTFITMTGDDPVRVENALFYYLALKEAGVKAELHVYPEGGHGYGLRGTEHTVITWPARAAEWMKAGGLLPQRP